MVYEARNVRIDWKNADQMACSDRVSVSVLAKRNNQLADQDQDPGV